ncbi:hypothetical protein [Cognatilysobacter bugurensis]|uniref:Uncharacterized protein n=1 Tax=Cognatilysobacter bugurensis TaxID=543356 RepID=A0A918W696_9GAMM|nr:hypothetical protein [Lysobacter bugurensis]GHA70448.1 hypothetical protein GCM10007067_03250 [Lysobacter bugurensis]
MLIQDRRRCRPQSTKDFRALLNTSQLVQLAQLERDGWRLQFVRQRPSQLPVTVLAARDRRTAVLRSDGRLDTTTSVSLRD